MESTSRVVETTTLEKHVIYKENGKDVVWAKVTRTFTDRKNPAKVVGELVNTFLCDDCYLEGMAEGDFLPVVTKEREMNQSFWLFRDGAGFYYGQVSYHKARRISERETSPWGRLQNRVYFFRNNL